MTCDLCRSRGCGLAVSADAALLFDVEAHPSLLGACGGTQSHPSHGRPSFLTCGLSPHSITSTLAAGRLGTGGGVS